MPAGVSAWTPLANLTLTGSASSVTFTSISGLYRDLVLVVSATGTMAGNNTLFRVNNVSTGSLYFGVTAENNVSTTFNQSLGVYSVWNGTDIGAGDFTQTVVQLLDYSVTDKHKNLLIRTSRPSGMISMTAGRFASTNAITSLAVIPSAGSWDTGSTFALYGVSA